MAMEAETDPYKRLWQLFDPESTGTLRRDHVVNVLVPNVSEDGKRDICYNLDEELTDHAQLRSMSQRISAFEGVDLSEQVENASVDLWRGVCRDLAETLAAKRAAAPPDGVPASPQLIRSPLEQLGPSPILSPGSPSASQKDPPMPFALPEAAQPFSPEAVVPGEADELRETESVDVPSPDAPPAIAVEPGSAEVQAEPAPKQKPSAGRKLLGKPGMQRRGSRGSPATRPGRSPESRPGLSRVPSAVSKANQLTFAAYKELVVDAGGMLRGEGIRLIGAQVEGVLQAMEMELPDAEDYDLGDSGLDVLVAGVMELGTLAEPKAIIRALQTATKRLGAERHRLELLVEDGDQRVDHVYDELELIERDPLFNERKRPIVPLTDTELETFERPSTATGIPKRTRQLPIVSDTRSIELVLFETVKMWYLKTLSAQTDSEAPTVIDEIVENLKVPRKSEGRDVGDLVCRLAEIAFALRTRLRDVYPKLGLSSLLVLWLSSMEGMDLDRILLFDDVPPTHASERPPPDAAAGDPPANAAPAAGGADDASPVDAAQSLDNERDEYARKYAGRRNPCILTELTLAMRGMRDACHISTSVVMFTGVRITGLNHAFSSEMITVEIHAKGHLPQRTEAHRHAAEMNFQTPIVIPTPENTESLLLRVTAATLAGKVMGWNDITWTPAAPAAPQEVALEYPEPLLDYAKRKIGVLAYTAIRTELDEETMLGYLEQLGADNHRVWAKGKLQKWVKVCSLLQALQSRTWETPVYRSVPVSGAVVAEHAKLNTGDTYMWLAPGIASADEAKSKEAAGSVQNVVSFTIEPGVGIDIREVSFYLEEAPVITPPFAQFKIEARQEKAVRLSTTETLESEGITVTSATRRFLQACLLDATRADEQLERAMERVLTEKGRQILQIILEGNTRRDEAPEKEDEVGPLTERLFAYLHDRLTPAHGYPVYNVGHLGTPVALMTSRATIPFLLRELVVMWYEKPGDVLDELCENLTLPSEAAALATLSNVAAALSEVHSHQGRNWMEILSLVLITLEGCDVDRLCLLPDTPAPFCTADEKEAYAARVGSTRNTSILSVLCNAVGSLADHQLTASLANTTTSIIKRTALVEPHRLARDAVQKWIKLFGLIMAMGRPYEGDLVRCCTPVPGETEQILALKEHQWGFWAASSRCSREATAVKGREGTLKVTCVIKGLSEVLDLTPYQTRHLEGDATPCILSPPLNSFLVREAVRDGDDLNLTLLSRDALPVVDPAVRKWREAIEEDCRRSNERLKRAFFQCGRASEEDARKRHTVTIGKKVVLADGETVRSTLIHMKEYRWLARDGDLLKYCDGASVGVVGNVTQADTTTVSDLRWNLKQLAQEMRGEPLDEALVKGAPPAVVSVVFEEKDVFVLPLDVLIVHPVSWMPEMASTVRVTIKHAVLRDTVTAVSPLVRLEIDDSHFYKVTAPPVGDLSTHPQDDASTSANPSPKSGSGQPPAADAQQAGAPQAEPAGPQPVWNEVVEVPVDRVKLAEEPLALMFSISSEAADETLDDYDAVHDPDNNAADGLLIGHARLLLSHHILFETKGRPRVFPLVVEKHDQFDHNAGNPAAEVTSVHTKSTAKAAANDHKAGILVVVIELEEEATASEAVASDSGYSDVADPLSWRNDCQDASDRICTGCDAGGEECTEAVYVCLSCDDKLCEDCWQEEHEGNPKKADHRRLLLYHHCDFCFVGLEASQKASTDEDSLPPALWRCSECTLNLCKQCWHDEHKHPDRRGHNKLFLYPGGETGPWAYATVEAQPVTHAVGRFYSEAASWKGHRVLICDVCRTDDAVYSWPELTFNAQACNPMLVCEGCFVRAEQDAKDDQLEAEATGLLPPRPRPPPTLLVNRCYLCKGLEGKPAIFMCEACDIPLCARCWKAQHRHPRRRDHKKAAISPPETNEPDTLACTLHAKVQTAVDSMQVVSTIDEPELHPPVGTLEPQTWVTHLRHLEAGAFEKDKADRARRRQQQQPIERPKYGDPFSVHDGYIGSGGDVGPPERMTVTEAKAKCLSMPDCVGFTFREEPDGGAARVFFKSKFNVQGSGKGWLAFKKEDGNGSDGMLLGGLCRHGALLSYCGQCSDARRGKPTSVMVEYRAPINTLEEKLATLIWDTST